MHSFACMVKKKEKRIEEGRNMLLDKHSVRYTCSTVYSLSYLIKILSFNK